MIKIYNLLRFLASFQGRLVRIIAGILLAFWGIFSDNLLLLVVGIIPLAAGIFDKCVFAPLFKLPFNGPELRKVLSNNPEIKSGSELQQQMDTGNSDATNSQVNQTTKGL